MPVYKGSYTETLTAAIAAFRAKQAPHIVQVFEVGTANMMAAKGAVYPVYQLMADAKEPFDPKALSARSTATTRRPTASCCRCRSTPRRRCSTGTRSCSQKAGLDPNKPPKTWPELGEMAKKAVAAGAKCGFTPQWQTWTMIENYGAWHNLPYATKDNGFGGTDIELKFNDAPRVKLIQMLADWGKDKTFVYGGREGKSTALFTAGDCVFHIASSGAASAIEKALGKDKVGIAMMPYSPDVAPKPQNSIIGGATLWVLQGKPTAEYKGVAKFLTFLSSAPVQAKWHQETGYVPITLAAAELTREGGLLREDPGPRHRGEGAHAQSADRELQGPAHRQLRADPRRRRRGAGSGVVRQEGRQGRPRRGGEARQRAAAQVRSGQQVGRALWPSLGDGRPCAPSLPLPVAGEMSP